MCALKHVDRRNQAAAFGEFGNMEVVVAMGEAVAGGRGVGVAMEEVDAGMGEKEEDRGRRSHQFCLRWKTCERIERRGC